MSDAFKYPKRNGFCSQLPLLADYCLSLLYRNGWAAELACRHGWHGKLTARHHELCLNSKAEFPPLHIGFASDLHAGPTTCPQLITAACWALRSA